MSLPPDQTIYFADNFAPPFTDGTYTVTVTQPIHGISDFSGPPSASKTFGVKGVRFALPKSDIYSIFPPANLKGHFSNCFPHMVFTRTVFPWERSIYTKEKVDYTDNPPSWVALLVFTEETDKQVVLQKDTAGNLFPKFFPTQSSPPTDVFYPVLTLDAWETSDEQCQAIDIPRALFQTLVPSVTDLQYLAHGRKITDVTNKAIQGDELSPGDFSVLMANRLAQTSKGQNTGTVTVHLVSLEGWEPYLIGAISQRPISEQTVRLISLYQWSFQTVEDEITFEEYMQQLNYSPLCFTPPNVPPTPTNEMVLNALNMGYLPFNHLTRLGDQTVSYYRGPLVPYPIEEKVSSSSVNEQFSPDPYVNFDPTTGFLDISYAAAFQLGQLLALQNKTIAIAIYEWKQNLKTKIVQQAFRLGHRSHESLDAFLNDASNFKSLQDLPSFDSNLENWLCNLILLQGIPFHYLVPDERLLPTESLRFFYLDYNWIQALLYGVFSLGAQTPSDAFLLQTLLPDVFQTLKSQLHHVRAKKLGQPAAPLKDPSLSVITGFLIRSQVVSGWPGLEVHGYPDPLTNPPPPPESLEPALKIKMELLSPSIMVSLFEGVVSAVKFREPSEGIHFGVEDEPLQKGLLIKELKYPLNNSNAGLLAELPHLSVTLNLANETTVKTPSGIYLLTPPTSEKQKFFGSSTPSSDTQTEDLLLTLENSGVSSIIYTTNATNNHLVISLQNNTANDLQFASGSSTLTLNFNFLVDSENLHLMTFVDKDDNSRWQSPQISVQTGTVTLTAAKGFPIVVGKNITLLVEGLIGKSPANAVAAPVKPEDPCVVNITQCNQELFQALKEANYAPLSPDQQSLYPSDFALQMTQGVEYVIFSTPSPVPNKKPKEKHVNNPHPHTLSSLRDRARVTDDSQQPLEPRL